MNNEPNTKKGSQMNESLFCPERTLLGRRGLRNEAIFLIPPLNVKPFRRFFARLEALIRTLYLAVKSQALLPTCNLDRDITVSRWGRLDKDTRYGGQTSTVACYLHRRRNLGRVTGESGEAFSVSTERLPRNQQNKPILMSLRDGDCLR